MSRFAATDFETANNACDGDCALGGGFMSRFGPNFRSPRILLGLRPTCRLALASVVILLLCLSSTASAALVEEVIDVPVSVKTIFGRQVNQTIKVTVFRDDARAKAPYLVLNHGRPPSDEDVMKMKRQRYPNVSKYFVSLGFVVLVPTRAGYGEPGGTDVEYTGRCDAKTYGPAIAAAADQTAAILKYAETLPYVDLTHGIAVGVSFGGITSIALAARDLPGLAATINFAGGTGGNPTERPARPCDVRQIERLYREYGAASRVPTLWLYSENDRFWGPTLPRNWFDEFVQAGGKGQFVALPAYGDDGHRSFTGNREAWKPAFEDFLREIGFFGSRGAVGPPLGAPHRPPAQAGGAE
jgi:dienelactone hydrolase